MFLNYLSTFWGAVQIILLILCFNLLSVAYGQENDTPPTFNNYSGVDNLTPSYKLAIVSDKYNVNPGDSINWSIFISGLGKVEKNKLLVYYPSILLNQTNPGESILHLDCINITINKTVPSLSSSTYYLNTSYPANFAQMVSCYFMYNNTNFPNQAPLIISETWLSFNETTVPPISLRFNTNKNAPPGDYIIELIFTYSDGNSNGSKWYQDDRQVLLHVNNPIEQNRSLIALLIGIITFFFPLIWSLEILKKFRGQFPRDISDLIKKLSRFIPQNVSRFVSRVNGFKNGIIYLICLAIYFLLIYAIVRLAILIYQSLVT
jgi:hypothetical protein